MSDKSLDRQDKNKLIKPKQWYSFFAYQFKKIVEKFH
jgi:hypothetical protein